MHHRLLESSTGVRCKSLLVANGVHVCTRVQVAFVQKVTEFAGALGTVPVGSEATLTSDTFSQGSVVVSKRMMDRYKEQQTRISDANKQGRLAISSWFCGWSLWCCHSGLLCCLCELCSDLQGGGTYRLKVVKLCIPYWLQGRMASLFCWQWPPTSHLRPCFLNVTLSLSPSLLLPGRGEASTLCKLGNLRGHSPGRSTLQSAACVRVAT